MIANKPVGMRCVGSFASTTLQMNPLQNILRLHSYFRAEYVVEVVRLYSPPGEQKRTCAK